MTSRQHSALAWFVLQCNKAKQCFVSRGYDHMLVSRGEMRAQYPLLMAHPTPCAKTSLSVGNCAIGTTALPCVLYCVEVLWGFSWVGMEGGGDLQSTVHLYFDSILKAYRQPWAPAILVSGRIWSWHVYRIYRTTPTPCCNSCVALPAYMTGCLRPPPLLGTLIYAMIHV